jgi:N-glycosylase/DNA lyase
MNSQLVNCEGIEGAVLKVGQELQDSDPLYRTWDNLSENNLWYTAVNCILGSRVKNETAASCTQHLHENGLIDVRIIMKRPKKTKVRISNELNKPIYAPIKSSGGIRYRYYNTRADYIIRSALNIYSHENTTFTEILLESNSSNDARTYLCRFIVGMGLKQASLFLRNVQYSDDLAILDSHVLRYISLLKLTGNGPITQINGNGQYRDLEQRFIRYADSHEIDVHHLDYAIWLVMRLIQREYVIWE